MLGSMNGPRLRPALDGVPAYRAGRPAPEGAFKISSNENPYPPLPSVTEALQAAAADINRYPDFASAELVAALADRFELPVEQIAVGTGSVGVAQQIVQSTAGPGDEVLFAWRSFEAYPIITAIAGARGVPVALGGPTRQGLDLAAMADAVTAATRLVFVCNPNNPTGTAVHGDALLDFLNRVPPEVLVVLDEAYHEFVTDEKVADGVDLLSDYPNLVVLRTFSKAHGLAGLRIGYGLAGDAAVATAARRTQVPVAVSGVAQAAALACLDPAAERQLAERVAELTAERSRVTDELRSAGFGVPDSEANFVWLGQGAPAAGGVDATAFAAGCEQHGVIVRAFAGAGVRVTVGTASENDRFLTAARALRGAAAGPPAAAAP
jgi:histidinol-phosphate aminotransferase